MNIEYTESITSLIFICSILIPIILICLVVAGIWTIHKSIDKQTAVQIRQAEALEQIFFLMRNQNINNRTNNPVNMQNQQNQYNNIENSNKQ